MGQAKKRGTLEQRIEQSKERQKAYFEARELEQRKRDEKNRQDYQRRVDAGVAIRLDPPRRPSPLPLLIGSAIAASLCIGIGGINRRPRI